MASFLRGMDPRQAVALDDSGRGDYYLFHDGEALVHRYRLGVWCRYRGAAFQEVRFGVMCGGEPVFAGEEGVYTLDNDWTVVTESGSPCAHFEHTIAITDNGPVILTKL